MAPQRPAPAPAPFVPPRRPTATASLVGAGFGSAAQRQSAQYNKLARLRAATRAANAASAAATSNQAGEEEAGASEPTNDVESTVPSTDQTERAAEPSVFEPDPSLESEAEPSKKHNKDYKLAYENLNKQHEQLYDTVTAKGEEITELQKQLKEEKGKVQKITTELQNHRQSLDHFTEQEANFQKALDAGILQALREHKKKFDDLQGFCDGAQSDLEDERAKHKETQEELDNRKADITTAQATIDALEASVKQYEQLAPVSDLALQYMEAINTLEDAFSEMGKELSPASFVEYLTKLQTQPEMNRHASGASINSMVDPAYQRNPADRKVSLHDEIANLNENLDDSDPEDGTEPDTNLNLPKQRRSSSKIVRPEAQPDAQRQELMEKIRELEGQKLCDEKKIRELEKRAADDQVANEEKNRKPESQNADDNKAFQEQDAMIEQQNASTEQQDTHDEEKGFSNGKPKTPPTDITRTHVKYVDVTRDATVWEALMKAPWLHKLGYMLLFFICLVCVYALAGRIEHQRWLSVNGYARRETRYLDQLLVVWSLRHALEAWLGLDTTLLG